MDDPRRRIKKKSREPPSITTDLPTVKTRPSLQGKKTQHSGPLWPMYGTDDPAVLPEIAAFGKEGSLVNWFHSGYLHRDDKGL